MNSTDYIIIAVAVIVVIGITALVSLVLRMLKPSDDAVAAGTAYSAVVEKSASPSVEITGTNPLRELTRMPEAVDPSTLPEEAKSILMNAVWYRCENPKCNYTQFLEVYHILPEEKEGTNSLDNLVVLCPECRFAAYSADLTEDELRSWVKERVERFKFTIDWPYK